MGFNSIWKKAPGLPHIRKWSGEKGKKTRSETVILSHKWKIWLFEEKTGKIEIITPNLLPLKMRKNFRSLWCQHVFPHCPFHEKDKFGKKLSVIVIGEDGCKCCYYTAHLICIWAGKFYFFMRKIKKVISW